MLLLTIAVLSCVAYGVFSQGYQCDGRIAFNAAPISEEELQTLETYGQRHTDDVNQCARECFEAEFCHLAIYEVATRLCDFSYLKRDCKDKKIQPHGLVQGAVTAISCFKCLGPPYGARWLGVARHPNNVTEPPREAPQTTYEVPTDFTEVFQ